MSDQERERRNVKSIAKRVLPDFAVRNLRRCRRETYRLADAYGLIGPEHIYHQEYFERMDDEVLKEDARQVVEELNAEFNPDSVIDFGCGIGLYLNEFRQMGVEVHGVDGSEVALANNLVPSKYLERHDLREPYSTIRKYDLAICFEVLEHLPERYADTVVETIASMAETAVVSAAPPGQGGRHHVNEQPREYWVEKFDRAGMESRWDVVKSLQAELETERAHWIEENLLVFKNLNKLNSPIVQHS
jgi:cyclopropane fatty-acyl-phospholipid synthase-like methyltransferase